MLQHLTGRVWIYPHDPGSLIAIADGVALLGDAHPPPRSLSAALAGA